MEVGKDLNIESLQDKETYDEKNSSSGFNFSTDVSHAKDLSATYQNAGITGGANKGKTNSNYESVTDQAGIYAGEGGFDIEVGKNTDLKGAVIASEADASKNKLSTDTLTYSDIENKAEYSASNSGFNFDSKGEIPITPNQGIPVKGEAESTTKSAIAEGTIEIRSNENQNISNLSRNTQEALNKLEKIFDAKTVKEQQELADLFGEVAFKAVGDIADRNWKNAKTPEEKAKWAEGGEYKILLHTLVGGMMSEFAGNGFKSGAISAGISQALQTQLSKIEDKGLRLIAGGLVAGTVNKVLGLKPEVGSSIAISGIKNNDYCHRPTTEGAYIFVEGQGYFIIENGIDVYMQGDVPPAGAVVWYQDYANQDYGNEFIKGDGGINLSDTYFQWDERTIIAGAGMAQQYVKIHVAVDDNGNDISVNGMPLISPDDYGEYQRALDLYNYYGGTSMDAKAGMILLEGGASLTGNRVVEGVGASNTIIYSPIKPGPLKPSVAESFRGATYTETVLTEDTVFYRVYGGKAGEVGSYMTRVPQNGGIQSQIDLALNPEWGNTTQYVTKVTVPKGTVIYEGVAAPQTVNGGAGQLLGGGNQIYIPEVNANWFK